MSATRSVWVQLRPVDPTQLRLSGAAALSAVRAGFGAAAVDVADVETIDDCLQARVRFDPTNDAQAALLQAHVDDQRLWHSWVESLYVGGDCRVIRSSRD